MTTTLGFGEVDTENILEADPVTPTDQPIEAVQPMAPARVAKRVANTDSAYSPRSVNNFGPEKKAMRVLMWGGC